MSGLAIICSHITGWKTGTWFFLFNIPVVALGIWKFGVKFILSTFYAVAAISACTNLFSRIGSVTGNPLLASWGKLGRDYIYLLSELKCSQ